MDQVVAELDSCFTGNNQDVLSGLGDVVVVNQPAQRSFQLVADHYKLDKDLLVMEQDMFRNFRDGNDDVRLEFAVDALECMHEKRLQDIGEGFEHHTSHFVHIREVFQRSQALENVPPNHDVAVLIE